jgi:hypothetical protein
MPTLGSIVQNGKLADCALVLDKQLNRVDFPTLGKPTMPHFKAMDKFLCKYNTLNGNGKLNIKLALNLLIN